MRAIRNPKLSAALSLVGIAALIQPLSSSPSHAAVRKPIPEIEALSDAVSRAAESVVPSVVNITATRSVKMGKNHPSPEDLPAPWRDFFRWQWEGLPESHETESAGSGFFIDKEGYILTNSHVVEDAESIEVTRHDKKVFTATVVGIDPKTDIALLKIDEPDDEIVPATLGDSSNLRVGQWAMAIGNPFSNFEGTVTFGIISATGRSQLNFGSRSPTIQDYIQTDASINPGNSGGPLINIYGEVIGINSAISTPSGGNVGIGFAIPINMAKEILGDLKEYGEVRRAFLGVNIQEVDPALAEALGLERAEGVLVSSVIEGTPAEKAGIKRGDVIVKFNGEPVTSIPKLQRMVGAAGVGNTVEVEVLRNGKRKTFKVTLERMDDDVELARAEDEGEDWLGLTVDSLDSAAAERFGVSAESGVVVTKVKHGSPAHRAGLQPGYVIQRLGEEKIEDLKDYRRALKELKKREDDKPILAYVQAGGGARYLAIAP